MKRFAVILLIAGYIMLVPFCFFGGILMANGDMMDMIAHPAHQMSDCGMPLGACTHGAGAMDTTAHHVSMYNSITQTPLAALTVLMALLTVSFAVSLYSIYGWPPTLLAQTSLYRPPRRQSEPESRTKQRILTWLSLFETSPNFA